MQSFRMIPCSILVCAAVLVGAGQALGDPLTFNFSGNITFVADFLNFDESVYVGAPFSGAYVFDPAGAIDSYPDAPEVGNYYFPSGWMWARIGNYEYVTPDLIIYVWNYTLGGDLYEPICITPFGAAGYQWSGLSLLLYDRTGAALDSDELPTDVPDLSDWPTYRDLLIERFPGDELGIRGRLTSLTPEPGSLALFALWAVYLCRRRVR